MTPLTSQQEKVYEFLKAEIRRKSYPPAIREICEGVGLSSTSTVHAHLKTLERKGYIRRSQAKNRSIEILETDFYAGGRTSIDDTVSNDALDSPNEQSQADYKGPSDTRNSAGDHEIVVLPIIGKVAAGMPILADENIEDTFPLPVEYISSGNTFMMRVKGDSMIDAGIFHRDLIIVREQPDANNGDIVVAVIGDSATVKTFYREKGCIRLEPANQAYRSILTVDARIIGKVIGLFRRF